MDAQGPPATSASPRLSFTFFALGGHTGGPSGGLEDAMRQSGYNGMVCVDEGDPLFCEEEQGPIGWEDFSFAMSLRYRVHSRFAAELVLGQAPQGETEGRRGLTEHLVIDHGGTFIAPLISIDAWRSQTPFGALSLHAGAGPAFMRSTWDYSGSGGEEQHEQVKTSSTGVMANVTGALTFRSYFRVELTAQHRSMGSDQLKAAQWSPGDQPARVSNTHNFFAFGVGLAF